MNFSSADPFRLTFFTARSGALSVRLDHEDGTSLHLHSLVDPEREADYFSDLQFWGDRIVLAGCGLGYHLKRALASVKPDTAILLVDFYEELATHCVTSFSGYLRDRVTVILPSTGRWEKRVHDFLKDGKYVQVVKHPASYHAHTDFYRMVLKVVADERSIPRNQKAIMLMQGDFFIEKELAQAALGQGIPVVPFCYKKWKTINSYELHLQKLLQTTEPRIVVSINMLGFDGNGILADYTNRSGVPVAVWFVDDPRPILLNQRKFVSSNMIAFSWERAYIPWLQQQGFTSVHHLPLATDPQQFMSKAANRNRIRCAFIGSSMGKRFLDEIAAKFIWKTEYEALARQAASRLLVDPQGDIDRFMLEESRKNKVSFSGYDEHTQVWLRSYVIHTASMLKRKSIITQLQSVGGETFGDPEGWRELCGPDIITHPDIDYHTGIAGCYRDITVNINITSCQMPSAVNQRVFDAPSCGAFILNDYQADLSELFSAEECITYNSSDELFEKVDFYFKNEQIRNSIINAARKRICNEHTYLHRLLAIVNLL